MTDAARAARILHGIERILDERTTPIPPRVMQQALRLARGALEGPMTPERGAVEAAVREPRPADAPKARWRYDQATRASARRLYEAGMGPTEIARTLGNGLRKQTINDWRAAGGWVRAAAPVTTVAPPPPAPCAPAPETPSSAVSVALPVVPAQSTSTAPPSPPPVPAREVTPRASAPALAKPPALGQLEPVPASIEDAKDWLYEELVRERGKRANHAEIEARIAMFTPTGLLREVNTRRLRHGLPPYVISGRAS